MEVSASRDRAAAVILEDTRAKAHQRLGPTKALTCIPGTPLSATDDLLLRTLKRLELWVLDRLRMATGRIGISTVDRRMHHRRIRVGIGPTLLPTAEEHMGNNTTTMGCTTTTRCHNTAPMAMVHMGEDIPLSGTCQPGETRGSRIRRYSRNKGALELLRIFSSRCGP